jgi:hypothetical protein
MNRLDAELRRLYLPPPAADDHAPHAHAPATADMASDTVSPGVRALALGVCRPAQWDHLARVWQGVQADLGLPAPAIAVSGTQGHRLWFSLAQAVPPDRAAAFVAGLRARYLPGLPDERVELLPPVAELPCQEVMPGQWSAFVTADLARIFEDEPWLDRPPSPLAQADVLARMATVPLADFDRALAILRPERAAGGPTQGKTTHPAAALAPESATVPLGVAATAHLGPRGWLRHVMGDPQVELPLRIEAAKALLPWTID